MATLLRGPTEARLEWLETLAGCEIYQPGTLALLGLGLAGLGLSRRRKAV